ncbi:MAG: AAA family ATPase, partial [Chloroflexi bacterium]|nr:AAA family ATPase [Chloroflexota bacterium]
MGNVYRANDRLTGQDVALKRVITADELLASTYGDTSYNPRLALAQEFEALASLRHPHIIAVLDYGFDDERQPYFTMDLLENAKTIVEAGHRQPLAAKITLLVQVLQALAYIHRRGLVHRDLKPGNVLVAPTLPGAGSLNGVAGVGVVKVLDFGLSVDINKATGTVGTLYYMAPEVLRGVLAGPPADLYAVGVLAYELFAGHNPFRDSDSVTVLDRILNVTPNVAVLEVPQPVQRLLERLLAKEIANRYTSADEVIRDLSAAIDQPVPVETEATRESFLQAARLVGREAELKQLTEALSQALDSRGGAWLVAGESGVGKSRLLDELRTRALVRGALVLRGQAVSDGGSPYEEWRYPLRQLALITDLSPDQAAILKTLLPDIERLLGRAVPDAPALDAQAAQKRLFATVAEIVSQQATPLLILLEDLHWSGAESLALLAWLNRLASGRSLLLVGNYRDDERPELPTLLPEMSHIKLHRLDNEAIARLSESMLGVAGRQAEVLSLLRQETEGNPFFVVEVVRALAEEAGQLDKIGSRALPTHVFTGGLQRLVERRLNRVPARYQPLLQIAAVAGRALDLKALAALTPYSSLLSPHSSVLPLDLEEFLTACANAAVVEKQGDQWHFAHDKLRTGLLANLPADRQQQFHRQIAQAIEQAYPGPATESTRLAHHWSAAGNRLKEAHYAALAGDQALSV